MAITGRPSDYSEEIIVQTKAYIDSCEDTIEQVVAGESETWTKYDQRLKVKLPTIEGLAYYLKISRSTLYLWIKEHDAFSDIIEQLQQKQSDALINNGLAGSYNPTIAKVLLTKHGYTDKQEIDQKTEHSGSVAFTGIEIIKPDAEDNTQVPS